MIYELFTFGGVFFWVLVAVFFIAVLSQVVYEKFSIAFFTVLGFFAILFAFSGVKWSFFTENKQVLIYGGIAYLLGALITSFLKWYFYVRDARDSFDEIKENFLERNGQKGEKSIPDNLKNEWIRHLRSKYPHKNHFEQDDFKPTPVRIAEIIPSAKDNKARIIGWMGYWPFVAFWSLMDDVFRRIWETMYRLVSSSYQYVSNFVFRGVAEDLSFDSTDSNSKK